MGDIGVFLSALRGRGGGSGKREAGRGERGAGSGEREGGSEERGAGSEKLSWVIALLQVKYLNLK